MKNRNEIVVLMGQRIKTAREALKMSQSELGTQLGKTQNTISNYESGTRAVHVGELPEFAAALKVTIPYFFGDEYFNEQLLALLSQLSPPFRYGILVVVEQQLELQKKLFEALIQAGFKVTPERLEEAGNLVQLSEPEIRKGVRDAFVMAVEEMLGTDTELSD